MWFTRLAISRPIMIWMCLLAIAILGTQAYFRLPAELNPRTEIPIIHVTTIAPGYAPPEVETQVTRQIEEAVGTVGGILDVSSSSQSNVSVVVADFKYGTNLDRALSEMRGRIEAIRSTLPVDVRPSILAKLDINALPVLYLGFSSPEIDLAQLRNYAENTLRPRLERVSGVATVQVLGGEQREIKVSVDGTRLRQFGITIADVINSLKAGGRDIPGGSVRAGANETDIRLSGAYTSLASIRNAPILSERLAQADAQRRMMLAQRGQPETLTAPPLTVADVAEVVDGNAERDTLSRVNGVEGIGVVITQESDANTVRVVDGVNLALDELKPTLPPGLQKITLRDDAVTVRGALEDVNVTLILGAFLAMGVILLFLHNLRGTIIVMLAIPACMVATFLVLSVAGFSLNQMTLLALSLSVGILVDDSIVVLESITRHLKMGKTPEQAALDGRAEIGFADVTTTLVDVVVFVPIGFMGGIVGSFFKQFGLTIATATLFSLIVSFSITPMLAARWYKQGEDLTPRRGLYFALEKLYLRLETVYRRLIAFALRRRALVLITGIATLGLIFFISFQRLGFEFLPGTDQGQIAVSIELPPGSSLAATEAVASRAETLIRDTADVAATFSNVGQVLGGFGYIPQQGSQFAQINVRLIPRKTFFDKDPQHRTRSDEAITTELRGKLDKLAAETNARISANALQNVQGVSSEIQIMLQANNLDTLNTFANQVKDGIAQIPGVRDPDVSTRTGKPEIRAQVDPQKAAQYAVPSSLVGSIIRDSLVGNTDTVFQEEGKAFPVRIQLEAAQRSNIAEVENLPVGTDMQGQSVLLADVATITRTTGTTKIDRRNTRRMITVTASLAPGFALGNVQKQIDQMIAKIPHDEILVEWGGEAKTIGDNAFYFASALILAVLLVYLVMASLFNNLGTPFVIMFTLPMALIGALGALVLTGETMSLVAAIGIIMLVGLMGRNAILLLDYTNTLRERGEARTEAIIEAGATRLRPILMTTTATIIGMLPVALRFGEAAETRAPMAIVVIGGLIVSTVLTLVVIPVLYSLFDDVFGKQKTEKNMKIVKQLHEAVKASDWNQVLQLIAEGADVNAREEAGLPPLLLAFNPCDTDIVWTLLEHGAELDARDNSGKNALMIALEQADFNVIGTLQRHATSTDQPLTINMEIASNEVILLFALYTNDEQMVRSLLNDGADPNAKDIGGSPRLHRAAEFSHANLVRLLLQYEADINARDTGDSTALHIAAYESNVESAECVRVLLEHGAEVDARDQWKNTPLINAAFASSATVVRILLEHGADIHAENEYGTSALAQAGWIADEETIRTLIEGGAASHQEHLRDAFRSCFTDNNSDKAYLFLEAGMQMRLLELVYLRDASVVQDVLSKGAERSELNAVLVRAAEYSTPEIVSMLLQAGADPDAYYQERSALMAASQNNRYSHEVWGILVQAGATKVSDSEEQYLKQYFSHFDKIDSLRSAYSGTLSGYGVKM